MGTAVDAYRAARTPAEYYAARVGVLQRAIPEEVVALADTPTDRRRRLPPAEREWLGRLAAEVTGAGPTVRLRERTLVTGVRSLIRTDDDGGAGLLVLFSGAAGRLNIPLATLLQSLPWAGREVLLVGDPTRDAYLAGIPGLATSLPTLADRIRSHAAGRRLGTLGTSMGGGPAVITGLLAGAELVAAVGGSDPLLRPGVEGAERAITAALAVRRSDPGAAATDVLCVHSEGNARDAANAAELLARVGTGRRVVVAPARLHNVLREAQDAGVLRDLLTLLTEPGPLPGGDTDPLVVRLDGSRAGDERDPAEPPPRRIHPERRVRPPTRRRDRTVARFVEVLPHRGPWRRLVVAAAYRLGVVVGVGRPARRPERDLTSRPVP